MHSTFTTRPADEAKTHELLADYLGKCEFNPHNLMISFVFKAQHQSALTVSRVARIAEALQNYRDNSTDLASLQAALTAMVKAKVLRSRMISGVRHYEVNY